MKELKHVLHGDTTPEAISCNCTMKELKRNVTGWYKK